MSNVNTYKIDVRGRKSFEASANDHLLKSLTDNGINLDAVCGAHGTCGKCRIKLINGMVGDQAGRSVEPEKDGYYLACQVFPLSDLVIDWVQEAGVSTKGEVGGITIPKGQIQPIVRKLPIKAVYPTLNDNYSLQDMVFKASGYKPSSPSALKQLANLAHEKVVEITLVMMGNDVMAIERGNTQKTLFGVAFDIGTTTVAGMLVDLNKAKVIAAAAASNPQAVYGADVISRIKAAANPEDFLRLTTSIRETLNDLIGTLCSDADISNGDVYLITVAGNTTMEHLFMGISPQPLAVSPYVSAFNVLPPISAAYFGLDINPGGRVQLLPNIASFVGADTVAAIVAVDQDINDSLTLLIDLGTNGELSLGNKEKLVVSSTAAGPAFEGAQLSSGMRASEGAIDDFNIVDGHVKLSTIQGGRPRGICGSGVIKVIAELIKAGIINHTGRLVDNPTQVRYPLLVTERLKVKNGKKEFVLAFAEESETGTDISITQQDIREIQLVKSSIYTGAEILMENLGVTVDQIEQVLIAGAFGSFIDIDSALTIGLIPNKRREAIKSVGNAAGAGSARALMSEIYFKRCLNILNQATFIELANDMEFQKRFVNNLSFPNDELDN